MIRKVRTWYGSFLSHLELSQKFKNFKNPFTDVIFRFQSTCNYNWQGQRRQDILLHEVRPFLAPDTIWVVLPFLY